MSGKVFECLPYNFLFNLLFKNDLISQSQFNFKEDGLYHYIDKGFESQGIFFNISRSIWKGMEKIGKKVVHNGQESNWENIVFLKTLSWDHCCS